MKLKKLAALLLALLLLLTACESAGSPESSIGGSGSNSSSAPVQTQPAADTSSDPGEQVSDPGSPTETDGSGESEDTVAPESTPSENPDPEQTDIPEESAEPAGQPAENENLPVYGEAYYDVENVVLYLEAYGELPPNFITKKEARELGWSGGSVENYLEGAAIGGDRFGNYEEQLPEAEGRTYTECDIDTNGYSSRGSRRLVFSSDGLYFYTKDHYEHFRQLWVTEDWEIQWED